MVSTVGIEEIRDEVKRMYSSSQATQTISVKPIDEFPNPGRWEPHQIALVTNGRFVGEAKRSRHSSNSEWIGNTPDAKIPNAVRLRVFERYGGFCAVWEWSFDGEYCDPQPTYFIPLDDLADVFRASTDGKSP